MKKLFVFLFTAFLAGAPVMVDLGDVFDEFTCEQYQVRLVYRGQLTVDVLHLLLVTSPDNPYLFSGPLTPIRANVRKPWTFSVCGREYTVSPNNQNQIIVNKEVSP